MKKKILLVALTIAIALGSVVIMPLSASAWSWQDDAKFEVAAYNAPIVNKGEIVIDAQLDDAYLAGTKISSYRDASPYLRNGYSDVHQYAEGNFTARLAADSKGLYIYAEIEDGTIFSSTNTNGNDGDCLQIYFDWCPDGVVHPSAESMYASYKNGTPWDYATYKTTNNQKKQYLGWISGDYNGVKCGSGGFSSLSSMGPYNNEQAVYKTRFINGGWACEWFIPWRDTTQRNAIKNGQQFHLGIGMQVNDDCDVNDKVTPGKEENVGIVFDQRKEIGLSYWADYSMLADVVFVEACGEHDFKVIESADKTCEAYGYNTYVCTKCNGDKTVIIPASHGKNLEYVCSVTGKKDVVCADCRKIVNEGVSATLPDGAEEAHAYVIQKVITQASCEEEGLAEAICKYCGHVDTIVTPAKGHDCPYSNKLGQHVCLDCGEVMTYGDANNDGEINNSDALAILKYVYDPEAYPVPALQAADLNGDGEITNADLLAIFKNIYNPALYPINYGNEEFQLNGVNISEYTIVYPEDNVIAEEYAARLAKAIKKVSGIDIKCYSDDQPYRKGREILVGYSTRLSGAASAIAKKVAGAESTEYAVLEDGNFLYLGGGDGDIAAVVLAVNKLIAQLEALDENYVEIDMNELSKPEGTKYSVITYNDGDNSTTKTSQVATILKDYAPDIIGMQEVQSIHISTYENLMPGYKGIYYDHDTTRYGAPIFYNTSKFTLVESGTQWLSATPDVKYSKFTESDYIRSYVYAILKDKTTGEEIVVVNTHVDYVDAANDKQIPVLLACTERFRNKPIIYTGDFNMTNTSAGYHMMKDSDLIDCGTALGENVAGHIDFCFVDLDTALPVAYKYISDHEYSATASDHKPVYGEVFVYSK